MKNKKQKTSSKKKKEANIVTSFSMKESNEPKLQSLVEKSGVDRSKIINTLIEEAYFEANQ